MARSKISSEDLENISGGQKNEYFNVFDVYLSDGSRSRFYSQNEADEYSLQNPGSFLKIQEVYGKRPRD